ncbi:tetratricopeptide repeat protein [Limnothrix sp. FACHB-881]|uniref:CHAT domain-containing protein n=1 Tax=Limnothrix sp. FACHB-881 TaxID=2692819 RepID=UPI00351C0EA5
MATQADEWRVEASRLNLAARQLQVRGQNREALPLFQKAYELYRLAQDRAGEGATLTNIGTVYQSLGQYSQALEHYRQALAILKEVGDRAGEGKTLNNLGLVYQSWGQYPQALEHYRQALAICKEVGDRATEGTTLNNIGLVYNNLGQYLQALEQFRQALAIRKEMGDQAGEGTTLNNIGLVYNNLGQYLQALEHYRQALAIRKEVGNRAGEGTTLTNIGAVYDNLGQYPQALEQFRQALVIHKEVGNRATEGTTLTNIGAVYSNLGQYPQALEHYRQALAIQQEVGDQAGEGTTLSNIGAVYDNLGQYPQALEQFRQALAIQQEVGDRTGEGATLNNIGLVYNSLGQYPQALEYYRQALAIRKEVGDLAGEGTTLNNIGAIYVNLGQYSQALEQFRRALAIRREVGDRAGVGKTLNNIGAVHQSLGQYPQALEQYRQALAILKEVGDRAGEGRTLNNIGFMLAAQQELIAAIALFKQSVAVYEAIRKDNRTLSPEQQKSYTEKEAGTYRELANLLINQGRFAEAERVLDLLVIQELSNYNQGTRATVSELGTISFTDGEKAILDKHNGIIDFAQKLAACTSNCNDLQQQYDKLTQEFQQAVAQVAEQVRQRKERGIQDPEELRTAAAEVVNQQPGTIVIQTIVQRPSETPDKRGRLWVLWTTQGEVANFREVMLPSDFQKTVFEFRRALSSADTDPNTTKQLGRKLYDWVIKPLESELKANDIKHLIFRLDRELRYIPMAALHDGDSYLIEKYSVANFVTLGDLNKTDRLKPPDQSRIAAFGRTTGNGDFKPLPYVADEVDAIVREVDRPDPQGGFYPGSSYLNDGFTRDHLQASLFNNRILHLATHGRFSPTNAANSALLLGQGNNELLLPEVETLRGLGNVHLVVLSACETALGGDPDETGFSGADGREISSLAYSFTRGDRAKAILASLWNVNDRSTSLLMREFYRRLAADPKLTKAEALRQAQVAFLQGELTRSGEVNQPAHPFYWSPFVLTGNSW